MTYMGILSRTIVEGYTIVLFFIAWEISSYAIKTSSLQRVQIPLNPLGI